jgi:hypothetical protein
MEEERKRMRSGDITHENMNGWPGMKFLEQ